MGIITVPLEKTPQTTAQREQNANKTMHGDGCFAAIDMESVLAARSSRIGPEAWFNLAFRNRNNHFLNLGTDWYELHFLLTDSPVGTPDPLSWSIYGGEVICAPVGTVIRLLLPDQVSSAAAALSRTTVVLLERSHQISTVPNLAESFDKLCAFYLRAAQAGKAVLLWHE